MYVCFTCGPGKPIFPGGPSKPCGERRAGSVYCLFAAFEEVRDDVPHFTFDLLRGSTVLLLAGKPLRTQTDRIGLGYVQTCAHCFFSEISFHRICTGTVAISTSFLPSCPLTLSLLLVRRAQSLPATQDSCHFTNRGHSNTAGEPATCCK